MDALEGAGGSIPVPIAVPDGKLRLLHLLLEINETSTPWNEHCLPLRRERDIRVCSYFRSRTAVPPDIDTYEGDGTLRGFLRALDGALADGRTDVIHAHAPHLAPLLAWGCWRRGISLRGTVFTVHTSFPNVRLRNRPLLLFAFACFERIVFCSRSSLQSFPRRYRWLTGRRVRTVPNGVDIDRIDRELVGRASRRSDGSFTIVSVGRIIPVKNPLGLLESFRRVPGEGARMLLVGEGAQRELVRRRAEDLGLDDRVKLTGLVPRGRVYEILSGADLFVSASRCEGMPMAVLEAMACRCPVLLSDIPPHREIAEGMDFIPLVPPGDVEGFAREIERFRSRSSAERAAQGEKCRSLVEERFSLRKMHAAYPEVYTEIIAARGGSAAEE